MVTALGFLFPLARTRGEWAAGLEWDGEGLVVTLYIFRRALTRAGICRESCQICLNDKKQAAALTVFCGATGLGALVTTTGGPGSFIEWDLQGRPLRVGHSARSCAAGKVGVQSEPCVSVLGSGEHRGCGNRQRGGSGKAS